MRDHLVGASERTDKVHPKLEVVAEGLPNELHPLWEDFMELHLSRGSTGFGMARITYQDIDAWQRVNRTTLRPWQIAAIRAADNIYLAQAAKRRS